MCSQRAGQITAPAAAQNHRLGELAGARELCKLAAHDIVVDRVRSVQGVAWATPYLQSVATIRTPAGDLEGVSVIGVEDTTLIGFPEIILRGQPMRSWLQRALHVSLA